MVLGFGQLDVMLPQQRVDALTMAAAQNIDVQSCAESARDGAFENDNADVIIGACLTQVPEQGFHHRQAQRVGRRMIEDNARDMIFDAILDIRHSSHH